MLIARTTVAGAMAVTSLFKKNQIAKLKGSADYKEFPSQDKYQRALRYPLNTIVTYSKTPYKTIHVRRREHPYKSCYNIVAGLLLYYKILKAAAMRLSK